MGSHGDPGLGLVLPITPWLQEEAPGLLGLSVAPNSARSLGTPLSPSGSSPIRLEWLGGTELQAGVKPHREAGSESFSELP